jgi:hypothetical protein
MACDYMNRIKRALDMILGGAFENTVMNLGLH